MQKQKNTKFKKWPLVVGAVAAVVATVLVPSASTWAWGPDRITFTMENPADYITLNSITNNTAIGDERNFVRVREADSDMLFGDEVKVVPGKEYEVYIYFHNNAKSSLNASGVGIATGTVATSQFSETVNSKSKGKVSAIISSPNATPSQLWDEAYFTTDSQADVALRYITASAKIYNNFGFGAAGTVLPDGLFGDGVFLGYNKLDGVLPACSEFSGHIIYRVRAEQVGAKIVKSVSKDGTNFFDKVSAQPGETLTYKVVFTNNGTTTLNNVTLHDKLPNGVTLIEGTSYYEDSVGNKQKLSDLIGQNGYNFGNYGEGVSITLTYQVRVNDDILVNETCGTHQYSNRMYADYNEGEISDDATFEVEKTGCREEEEPEPEPECQPGEPGCTTPEELPHTGPAEIALAVTAIIAVVVGTTYWYHSQKALEEAQAAAGTSHKKTTHKNKK